MRYEPKVPMDLSTWDSGEKTLAAVMRALVETTSYVNDTMRLSREWGRGISLFMRVQVPASHVEALRTKLGKLAELKEPPQVHLNTTKAAPQPAPAHERPVTVPCTCTHAPDEHHAMNGYGNVGCAHAGCDCKAMRRDGGQTTWDAAPAHEREEFVDPESMKMVRMATPQDRAPAAGEDEVRKLAREFGQRFYGLSEPWEEGSAGPTIWTELARYALSLRPSASNATMEKQL